MMKKVKHKVHYIEYWKPIRTVCGRRIKLEDVKAWSAFPKKQQCKLCRKNL